MIVKYLVLICIIGLSFIECLDKKIQTVKNDLSDALSLDEAYLIVRNTNSSTKVALYGNKIICEKCDLEEITTVDENQTSTVIIDTKYSYHLEFRSLSSKISLLCQISSYKFAEHGTYLLDTNQITQSTDVCSIKQIGNPSNYLAPAIIGIVFVVLYTVLVQLSPHIYRSRYFRKNNSHQPLIDDTPGSASLFSTVIIREEQIINEDIIHNNNKTNPLTTDNLTPLSTNKTRTARLLPKRLRALDTFRGFSLMLMIFVNYGGMYFTILDKKTNSFFFFGNENRIFKMNKQRYTFRYLRT
jgi:hypothetical protein